jgi:hypothetical protein
MPCSKTLLLNNQIGGEIPSSVPELNQAAFISQDDSTYEEGNNNPAILQRQKRRRDISNP